MTPAEQAAQHMPGRERIPWRQLSWDRHAKLWVHLGIRRVTNMMGEKDL